jgi:hypothetical protein
MKRQCEICHEKKHHLQDEGQHEDHITSPFACDDLNLNDSHREATNNQAHPIAQPS